VERIEFTATLDKVKDGVVIEDVAVNVEARTSPPVKTAEPPTESVRYGDVVPIPMLPTELTKIDEVAWACPESFPTTK